MIFGLLCIILATIIFVFINSILDIVYFGCGAMGTMWFMCFLISYAILEFLGYSILGLLKWLIIVISITFIIKLIVNKK